jgi:hypothetical protein
MAYEHWIPRREQDVAGLIGVWMPVLSDSANIAAFGWTQNEVTDVLDRLAGFLSARTAYTAEDSTARRRAKNAARYAAESAMRDFANSSVRYNKRVDDETKERLLRGKKTRAGEGAGAAAGTVPFTLEGGGYLQIIVRHPARPPRCAGASARYKVGGPPPSAHNELTESRLLTRPREILTFGDADLGETLYIALSWQTGKGRLGPPSPIQSRVIA